MVAIIAVLVGIAVIGLRTLEQNSRARQTKVILGTASSMFAEYKAATALKQQPAAMYGIGAGKYTTAGFDI